MTKAFAAFLVLALVSRTALGQPADSPALDAFLEQRAAEELATEGTLLSRLGVGLEVELVGTHALVSLVDLTTRRPVASTKLESLPADRDAAAAAVTVVAANLVSQIGQANGATAAASAAVQAVLEHERSQKAAREQAEYHYRREAVTFGDEVVGVSGGKTRVVFRAYHGGRPIDGADLLDALGRTDLADRTRSMRRRIRIGVFGGTAAVIFGGGLLISSGMQDGSLQTGMRIGGLVLGGAGVVGLIVGIHAAAQGPGFTEAQLYDMADEHNAKVRAKYGLSPAVTSMRRPPSGPSFTVAPLAMRDGGGLSVAGRF